MISCKDNSVSSPPSSDGPSQEIVWEKSFNDNADNWITDETSGANGWCGNISHNSTNEGPVVPSAGLGYALAQNGSCNDFWEDQGVPRSGPYAFFGELAKEWPAGGFVQALDIYLDPEWSAGPGGTVFVFSNSFRLLDGEYPTNLRYFFVPVIKQNKELMVLGNKIASEGWYSFNFIFRNNSGSLAVNLEVHNNDKILFTKKLPKTSQSSEEISSFEATNIGNGYAWFVAINPDLEIPVDEQKMYHSN